MNVVDLFARYTKSLCDHAHCLIAEGYASMVTAKFTHSEEPEITGELVREMKLFLESDSSPDWAEYYSIADDPALNVGNKLGKKRPRVDIEFERVCRGKRPRLQFEAKRLCSSTGHTVKGYLGKDGLGCFRSGKYPTTHNEAGMLGYIQSHDSNKWAKKIEKALTNDSSEYELVDSFQQSNIPSLNDTYISCHMKGSTMITIYHVLLSFSH